MGAIKIPGFNQSKPLPGNVLGDTPHKPAIKVPVNANSNMSQPLSGDVNTDSVAKTAIKKAGQCAKTVAVKVGSEVKNTVKSEAKSSAVNFLNNTADSLHSKAKNAISGSKKEDLSQPLPGNVLGETKPVTSMVDDGIVSDMDKKIRSLTKELKSYVDRL